MINPNLTALFSVLGEKWSLSVLALLLHDTRRFTALKTAIPGLSQRMLAETLRKLETAKLVHREVVTVAPRCVVYSLTERGTALYSQVHSIQEWLEQADSVVT